VTVRPADPTEEELALLSTTERVSFRIADVFARHLHRSTYLWRRVVPGAAIWACGSRRLRLHGMERLEAYGPRDRILLVANHRSYFDFYVIAAIVYWRTNLPHRILFPVRSTFFYDHPLGTSLNMLMSGMSMFPPILRDPARGEFNKYTLRRCVEELGVPGTVLGLHPEGTRGTGPDPRVLLPAQPGVGRVALEAAHATVIPVFVDGIGNDLAEELRINWREPARRPVDVVFGPPVDLQDLRANGSRMANWKRAADRCAVAIAQLADTASLNPQASGLL
jgi:1-acyl-sn-glycerol-3-phosphate acyltransferase